VDAGSDVTPIAIVEDAMAPHSIAPAKVVVVCDDAEVLVAVVAVIVV
jgi:hypothetical protein